MFYFVSDHYRNQSDFILVELIHFHVYIFCFWYIIHHLQLWYKTGLTIFYPTKLRGSVSCSAPTDHWTNRHIKTFKIINIPINCINIEGIQSKSNLALLHSTYTFTHISVLILFGEKFPSTMYHISIFFSTHQYSTRQQLLKLDSWRKHGHQPISHHSFIFHI